MPVSHIFTSHLAALLFIRNDALLHMVSAYFQNEKGRNRAADFVG